MEVVTMVIPIKISVTAPLSKVYSSGSFTPPSGSCIYHLLTLLRARSSTNRPGRWHSPVGYLGFKKRGTCVFGFLSSNSGVFEHQHQKQSTMIEVSICGPLIFSSVAWALKNSHVLRPKPWGILHAVKPPQASCGNDSQICCQHPMGRTDTAQLQLASFPL